MLVLGDGMTAMIRCLKCDHLSFSSSEAHQHWLEQHWLERYWLEDQPEKGMLVTVIMPDGQRFTDRVTDVVFDRMAGGQKIVVGDDKLARTMKLIRDWSYASNLLLKPRWVPLWAWKVWLKIRR